MAKKTADEWFEQYSQSHQNPINKVIHWICVPLIAASLIGMIWDVPTPSVASTVPLLNWATLCLTLALIFYIRLSVPLAIGMFIFAGVVVASVVMLEHAGMRPIWPLALGVFIAAWIGQFLGHKIERKKPSFFQDVQFLLIGPIWLLGALYRKLGIRY